MTPRTLIIAALSAAAAFAAGSALIASTAPKSTAADQEIVGLDLSQLTPSLDGQVWTLPSEPAAYWDDEDDDDDYDDHDEHSDHDSKHSKKSKDSKEEKKAKDHNDRHHDDDDDDDDHHDRKTANQQYEDADLGSAWLTALVSL